MNEHTISNESLIFSLLLVLVAIFISRKEKLSLEKDIIWSTARAIIQLFIVGYVLTYIFDVDHIILTFLMVLFICYNAAYNAKKRSKYVKDIFIISFVAITTGALLTLSILLFT
ncbi:ABC transporter permease, partial [Proteus mirabilis]|nr:ABC transporter permease [Proteus mirabilis]